MKNRVEISLEKVLKNGIMLLVILCAVVMWNPIAAEAKEILRSTKYSIDVNGDGKKETIKWTEKAANEKVTVKLYVNGKKAATVHSGDYALGAQVSVIDINKKDKYKDIYVQFTEEDDCFVKGYAYQYKVGKLKNVFKFENPTVFRVYIVEKQKGDGLVYFSSEYFDKFVMMGNVEQAYKIQSGKLQPVNQKVLKTTDEWRKNSYKTKKALKVYTHIGDKSSSFTLSKKDRFRIYKIKFVDYKDLNKGIAYIYVKTDDGKSGWVKNPKKKVFLGKGYYGDWGYNYVWG